VIPPQDPAAGAAGGGDAAPEGAGVPKGAAQKRAAPRAEEVREADSVPYLSSIDSIAHSGAGGQAPARVDAFARAVRENVPPLLLADADLPAHEALARDWVAEQARTGPVLLHHFRLRGEGIAPSRTVVVPAGCAPEPGAGLGSSASLYVPLNPCRVPTGSQKASKHHVTEVRCLGVDIDVDDPPADCPDKWQHQLDGRAAIARVVIAYAERHGVPSECRDSGGGAQLVFRLAQPVRLPPARLDGEGRMLRADGLVTDRPDECEPNADRERAIAEVEARNRGLFARFRAIADELGLAAIVKVDATQNVDRIFRVPHTPNRPGTRKRNRGRQATMARLVFADPEVVYPIDSFPLAATKAKSSPATVTVDPGARRHVPLESLPDAVSGRCRKVIVHGRDDEQPLDGGDQSRSAWLLYVVGSLVRAGVADDAIYSIVTDPDYRISASVLDKGGADAVHRYALRQIERARETAAAARQAAEAANADAMVSPFAGKGGGGDDDMTLEQRFRARMAQLGVRLEYDEFRDRISIRGLPGYGPHLDDAALARLRIVLAPTSKRLPPKDMLQDLCTNEAHHARRHPIREYLAARQQEWDGAPRVDTWLVDYLGAPDTPYVRAVSRIFLVAAVRRVRRPGVKFDELLVLEGDQGRGKSTVLKRLAVDEDWFTDDLPLNADGKRMIEQTRGKWIIECGELRGMRRHDIEALKATLSRSHDRARLAWGRIAADVPRQWVGAGTTNSRQYLRDQTGNRRFWGVPTGDIDLARFSRAVVDQLWGEAAREEARGDPQAIRLDPALYDAAAAMQAERTAEDPVHELLAQALDGQADVRIPAEDVWCIVGYGDGRARTQELNVRLGETMQRLGYSRERGRRDGKLTYWYRSGAGTRVLVAQRGLRGEFLGLGEQGVPPGAF
jgi:predicted P-loop ATPase